IQYLLRSLRWLNCVCLCVSHSITGLKGESKFMHQMRQPALRLIAFLVIAAWGVSAQAVGLGPIRVQSALGQSFRANITLIGSDAGEITTTCVKAKLESSDGVFLGLPQIGLTRGVQPAILSLTLRQSVNEPALTVNIELGCISPVQRTYQILLDPPMMLPQVSEAEARQAVDAGGAKSSVAAIAPATTDAAATGEKPAQKSNTSRAARRQKSVAANDAIALATAKEPAPVPSKKKKVARDVLSLSGDDGSIDAVVAALKLSSTLSSTTASANLADTAPDPDPVKTAELRAAQLRFAAILRGEDPVLTAEAQVRAAQARAQSLQSDTARLQQQTKASQINIERFRETSFSWEWVATLAGLLLLCLTALCWLLWRIFASRKTGKIDWLESGRATPASGQEKTEPPLGPAGMSGFGIGTPENSDHLFHSSAPVRQTGSPVEKLKAVTRPPAVVSGLPTLESTNSSMLSTFSGKTASLKVEEISDVTQEAEFWMSLNEPQRALEILEPQSDVDQPDSPVPWLYLLDIYRDLRDREKYDALRERLERLFNARIPQFGEDVSAVAERSLEDYPHLLKRICDVWNDSDILALLESLLIDDRDGARAGFDLPIYRDILMLSGVARELNRSNPAAKGSPKPPGVSDMLPTIVFEPAQNTLDLVPIDDDKSLKTVDFNIDIVPPDRA
ncbi:MAG: hypothetical protein V4805_07880, partial [Pseudomonadota bacterium]